MGFDILQILEFLGNVLTYLLIGFSFVSKVISEHSDVITIAIPIIGAILVWLFHGQRTKRRLKVDVSLSPNAPEFFKGGITKIGDSAIWDVFLINSGYHTVYIEEVGLLYRDWQLGKNKNFPIVHVGGAITISPGNKILAPTYLTENIKSCPREISGAYAKDKTGKVWSVRKRLKVEE